MAERRAHASGAGLATCHLAVLLIGRCALLPLNSNSRDREGPVLVLGLLPVSSPFARFERFASLRDYLGLQLGRECASHPPVTSHLHSEHELRTS